MASYYDVEALKQYIRDNASKYGLDPDTALKVWGGEGLKPGIWQSNIVKNGVREPSYGPFQFYMGGGMGNQFQSATGLDPRDPKNVYAMADYAMSQAGKGGWSPWYAARNQGISQWQGIKQGVAQPTGLGYAETNPAFQRSQGSTAQIATLPGPTNPIIQAASDTTKSSVPTTQQRINNAVQLSTRRGEAIPGFLGPSRGRALDKSMLEAYVSQGLPTSSANIAQATSPVAQATSPPIPETKPPVPPGFSSTSPSIQPQNNYFQNLKPSVEIGNITKPITNLGSLLSSPKGIASLFTGSGASAPPVGMPQINDQGLNDPNLQAGLTQAPPDQSPVNPLQVILSQHPELANNPLFKQFLGMA